jgi:hypothetical protein
MHPETDIAEDFWRYMSERTHGGDSAEEYPWPTALVAEEVRKYWTARALGRAEKYRRPGSDREGSGSWEDRYNEDTGLPPAAFPTLQAALYDYLIATVGGRLIAYDYDLWLRAVAHILADVHRDPSRLELTVTRDEFGHDPFTSTMVVSEDWSVLLPTTFAFARRNYERYG